MKGRIFDGASTEQMIKSLAQHPTLKDKPVYFSKRKEIADKIYDADTVTPAGMFIEQQLKAITPRILEQRFPGMPAMDILKNIDNSGTYMQAIIQRIQTYGGDLVNSNAVSDDNGVLTFSRDGKIVDIQTYKGTSKYDSITLGAALMYGENIDQGVLMAHKNAYERKLDEAGFIGLRDSRGNLIAGTYGIANYPNVITGLRLDSGSTFATYVAAKDGAGMYSEVEKIFNAHIGASGGHAAFIPDTLVLPPLQYSALSTTPFMSIQGALTTDTVRTYIERNMGVKIYASNRCIGAGDAGSDRMILLNAGNENVIFYLPMPLEFLPMEFRGGDYYIYSRCRVAGVSINYDNAISYLDKI